MVSPSTGNYRFDDRAKPKHVFWPLLFQNQGCGLLPAAPNPRLLGRAHQSIVYYQRHWLKIKPTNGKTNLDSLPRRQPKATSVGPHPAPTAVETARSLDPREKGPRGYDLGRPLRSRAE